MTDTITATSPAQSTEKLPWPTLIVLAFAVFATVTTEMIPAGLLPAMSADFGVPPLQIGLLVTVWAATIIVASLPLVRLTTSIDRRTLIAGTLTVFAVANFATALAPIYEVAVASRVIAAMAHGVFWAVVMVYASELVPARHTGRVVAIVSGGASVAILVGIPLGTAIGQYADWRWVFAGLATSMAIAAAIIATRLPRVPGMRPLRDRPSALRDRTLPAVLAVGVAGALTATASFTLFTYISPYLTEVAGFAPAAVSPLLLLFGVTGIGGLVLASTGQARIGATMLGMLLLLAAALLTLGAAPGSAWLVVTGVAAWGFVIGGLPAMIQTRMLLLASPALRATASALMLVFFNAGIGAGSFLGGVLADGPGLVTAAITAGLLAAAGGVASVAASALNARVTQ